MFILVSNVQAWRDELAGKASPNLAFAGSTPTWPGGNVYYTFDTNVSTAVPAAQQQIFIDCANEWSSFANVHFIPRTTQTNYVLVSQVGSEGEGGLSSVGMVGGQQILQIAPGAWNHATVCHEMGHTLGLVHEHQRSDRGSYVNILTNNIESGELGNFVLLGNSINKTPYDFLSVMHYRRNAFSTSPSLDTMEPLAPYTQYINIMGQQFDPVLSQSDRAGMAAVYGAGPAIGSVVSNTADSGPGSLRIALYYAFDHPGTKITFNIPKTDPNFNNRIFTILPTDRLPSLVNATTLDGTTQPINSNAPGPAVMLNGSLAVPPNSYANGLRLGGTNCVVENLIVNGFATYGIVIDSTNASDNTVEGCYLGTDATGTTAVTNMFSPMVIDDGAHNNTIGGTSAAQRNIISGSPDQGLVIRDPGSTNNLVIGNYIGLNAAGTAPLSNTWSGVAIFNGAQSNIIGGASATMRNIIAGNGEQGVTISDPGSTGNIIEGNYIGLNPGGTAAISNAWAGVNFFQGASGNIVGESGAPNIISGNGYQGILIQDSGSSNNIVEENIIGLNPAGTGAISNGWSGVEIYNGPQWNTIGPDNLISGNGNTGVIIDDGSSENTVSGNLIGLDVTGTTEIPNAWAGVELYITSGNLIGGTGPGDGNVISGNGDQGILFYSAGPNNLIEGNYIGLDISGLHQVANGYPGIEVYANSFGNIVGGELGARNYICGNDSSGISIDGGSGTNIVQGNSIGANVAGASVPNLYQGIYIDTAVSNLIGGTSLGAANFIAYSPYDGVDVFNAGASNNTIRGNTIVSNGGGINIYYGANASATAPTLSSATLGTNLTVSGTLAGTPSTTFSIDFYASPASSPEGAVYLGARNVTTSAGGSASFTINFSGVVAEHQVITATATDPFGNTSSMSGGITVSATDSAGDGIPNAWRVKYFGGTTTNSTNCATCDADRDGVNNLQEFLAGTNPDSASSILKLLPVTEIKGTPTVSFNSSAGIVYRVSFSDNLATGQWQILADQIIGTGGEIQIADTSAPGNQDRFYRLEVLP